MKTLFVGSKGMGVLALEELSRQGADIIAVVARWDDPSPDQWYPSVTECANKLGLPVFNPTNINHPDFIAQVKALAPDLMFTAFYPKIYKRKLLEIPPQGSINLHFAPLPRYRGSYPGAWAIINGEKQHGVTMHYMDPNVDSGDLVGQRFVDVSDDETGQTLYDKCERKGLELVRETWPLIANGTVSPTKQQHEDVVYYDRNYPYGGVVNFNWEARQVHNYVRAMTFPPFPNPFTFFNGRKLTILRTSLSQTGCAGVHPGRITDINGAISVSTDSGVVRLEALEDNRGKARDLDDIVSDYSLKVGDSLGR